MILLHEATLDELIIHTIAGKGEFKQIRLSDRPVKIAPDLAAVLKTYFLDKFRNEGQQYRLFHEYEIAMNEVFAFCKMIFNDEGDFTEVSQAIANFLYSKSGSANIKDGEVYVTKLGNIVYDDESVQAIGIFKSENKDTFLKVFPHGDGYDIQSQEGINIKKLDKGVIVLNTEAEDGYRLLVIDQTNKKEQAKYWVDDFLKVQPVEDEFYQTDQVLEVFKQINNTNQEDFDGQERLDLVSSSVEFIENNETFDNRSFYDEVLHNEKRRRLFEKVYEEQNGQMPDPENTFDVSKKAVKKSKRFIRSVIKLDNSFHVYVHANRDRIERGFDESKQLNYYKLYFNGES
ncbi:MAG: nucleoid-associated protein [Cyclobacteriaceae bacterium]